MLNNMVLIVMNFHWEILLHSCLWDCCHGHNTTCSNEYCEKLGLCSSKDSLFIIENPVAAQQELIQIHV